MLRSFLLASSILTVFILAWCLGRSSAPKNCLESQIVSNVQHGGKIFSTCGWGDRYLREQPPKELTELRVFERLDNLGAFFAMVNAEPGEIFVRIVSEPSAILWERDLVQISLKDLAVPGKLERAVMSSRLYVSSELTAEVLAEFLWQVRMNQTEPDMLAWVHLLSELNGYCSSSHPLMIHEEFCGTHNEYMGSFISNAPQGPMAWSFKPLYVETLKAIYNDLDLPSRRLMLSRLSFIGDPADEFISETETLKVDLLGFEHAKNELLRQWLLPLGFRDEDIHPYLAATDISSFGDATYVIVGRSARGVFPFEFWKMNREKRRPVIVESGSVKYLPPSDVSYTMSRSDVAGAFKIRRILYVSCTVPSPETLFDYEKLGEQIVFIRQCEPGDIQWQELIDGGMDSYLVQNPQVEFVEFSLSALRLAERLRGQLDNPDSLDSWSRWLIWQDELDEIAQIRRPLAVIEGVRRYRFQ